MVRGPCLQAISSPWCRTVVTLALCEVIQISFPLDRWQFAASSRGSNLSHSTRFMVAGRRRTLSQTQKQQSCDLLNVICARLVLEVVMNCMASAALATIGLATDA